MLECLHMKARLLMLQMANEQLSEAQVSCHHILGGGI
jgi:hypothetical protein